MWIGPMNATRHVQKPLPQPSYRFSDVAKATRLLAGSTVHSITDRNHFHEAMGEMLLLCKEASRRRPSKVGSGSKPLSLEYLADRLDIDDPCFGFLVRTAGDETVARGMLQGFITVTTFTNWQRTFQWDSANEAAYECDDEWHTAPERVRDLDGSLARGLQSTVRCGDIHEEGIVWPRIAEISLLGGLGCGKVSLQWSGDGCVCVDLPCLKALVELVIEQLECMRPTTKANYEYVVLQATDNSIPFYESLGFVRVGAVMRDVEEQNEDGFVTNSTETYTVTTGESLKSIAAKLNVDVWDLLYLNRSIIGEAKPSDKPFLQTVLLVPSREETEIKDAHHAAQGGVRYHVAKENETPRTIAKRHNVGYDDVVRANRIRFPSLLSTSRLKEGTRIRVSHFEAQFAEYKAYAHWSFPDKLYDEPEPSYMMARKLNHRQTTGKNMRPFEQSLHTPIVPYEKPPLLVPPSPSGIETVNQESEQVTAKPPPRPPSAYMIFAREQREQASSVASTGLLSIRDRWNQLDEEHQSRYKTLSVQACAQYKLDLEAYKSSLVNTANKVESPSTTSTHTLSTDPKFAKRSLYNKVVRLRPSAMTESSEYTYWYVLTFIPDLKWCLLAPMYQDGVFGSAKPSVRGKPRWKLVDESLGMELDISSSFCIPIKSRSMRRTLDADKEEWVIVDDGSDPTEVPITPRDLTSHTGYSRGSTAVKPSAERIRRRPSFITESPTLLATIPNSGKITTVKITGHALFGEAEDQPRRKRGRPKGSKNKPKPPPAAMTLSAKKSAAIRSTKDNDCAGQRRKSAPATMEVQPASDNPAVKRRPGRPPKGSNTTTSSSPSFVGLPPSRASSRLRFIQNEAAPVRTEQSPPTKRRPGRPRKSPLCPESLYNSGHSPKESLFCSSPSIYKDAEQSPPLKRGRGRPRKHPLPPDYLDGSGNSPRAPAQGSSPVSEQSPPMKRGRGRPRKHPLPPESVDGSGNTPRETSSGFSTSTPRNTTENSMSQEKRKASSCIGTRSSKRLKL